ncbi:MAG: hypothetical protein DHS20C13_29200 [Thermodesulfobacteriota bacterium]|nr:MAG: hypothetical protein DHS20C13_29200 [Thermodesulfobacteriota bacterium]
MDTFVELLKLGTVGFISGLLSAYFAIRIHRNEKWWELRVAAYQSVIEALSDLTHYYNANYLHEIGQRELSGKYKAEIEKFWSNNYQKIRKAADSGIFLFSEEVNKSLKEFIDLDKIEYDSYFEYLDSSLPAAEKCLRAVVSSANKDLRLKDTWL